MWVGSYEACLEDIVFIKFRCQPWPSIMRLMKTTSGLWTNFGSVFKFGKADHVKDYQYNAHMCSLSISR